MSDKEQLFKSLLLTFTLALVDCGGGSSTPVPVLPNCSIEINADSILSARGIPKTGAQYLQELNPNWIIDDRAVGGNTLRNIIDGCKTVWVDGNECPIWMTVPFNQSTHISNFVVIELGANDGLDLNLTVAQFETMMRGIISDIRTLGKIPIITQIVPMVPLPYDLYFTEPVIAKLQEFNVMLTALSKELNVINARFDTVPFNPETDLLSDGIHRTESYTKLLVARLSDTIKPLCK
jgi:hypothetical protein